MTLNERIHSSKSPGTPGSTCISWMVALNWGERSVHCFSSSIPLSKFFTYSAYILRKGVSFCRISPIRGVDALQGGRGGDRFVPLNVREKKKKKEATILGRLWSCFHAHHSPMRFSRSGSRNWLWKVWMEEMLEKMFFTTSTGNVPLFASSISLAQNTWEHSKGSLNQRSSQLRDLLLKSCFFIFFLHALPGPAGSVEPHRPSLCVKAHWQS